MSNIPVQTPVIRKFVNKLVRLENKLALVIAKVDEYVQSTPFLKERLGTIEVPMTMMDPRRYQHTMKAILASEKHNKRYSSPIEAMEVIRSGRTGDFSVVNKRLNTVIAEMVPEDKGKK